MSPGGGSAAFVSAYDALLSGPVASLVAIGGKLGGEYKGITSVLEKAFKAERAVVAQMATSKQPDMAALQKLLGPTSEAIMEAHKLADGKRTDAFNHYKCVAEALAALSWVAYTGPDCGLSLPAPHVDESWQSGEFWSNKILMQHKGKDANQVDWVKACKEVFVSLKGYVKEHHTQGPKWNPAGGAAGAGGPPPPPPPPPPGSLTAPRGGAAPKGGMSAVFSELNKGEGVTAGLKKVTDDMKTKNRPDRGGAVPADVGKGAVSSHPLPAGAKGGKKVGKAAGAPKCELMQGRKWMVENQDGNKNLVIDNVATNQTVYVYRCNDSVVQVKGKANNITLDGCRKVGLVFDSVLAAVEVINSESCEVQCTGSAPTIAIDECAGVQCYLAASATECSITTAKSSEINVLTPDGNDMVESAIPEQFVSVYNPAKKVWKTETVQHSGA